MRAASYFLTSTMRNEKFHALRYAPVHFSSFEALRPGRCTSCGCGSRRGWGYRQSLPREGARDGLSTPAGTRAGFHALGEVGCEASGGQESASPQRHPCVRGVEALLTQRSQCTLADLGNHVDFGVNQLRDIVAD